MNIAIVTNIDAAIGLATEYCLLREFLVALGHEVTGIQYDTEELPARKFDLMISMETVSRCLFDFAPLHWYFANPEWFKPHLVNLVGKRFDKIFCKTHEAERILAPMFPGKVHYVGFLTRDQYDPGIPRENKFLHIGGNSSFRGTQTVLDAWKWEKNGRRIPAELTIVSTALKDRTPIPNVTLLDRVTDEELKVLQNSHLFHLYPAGTEGFGHAIHEALSVNAVIVTTAAPPMDEIRNALPVRHVGKSKYNLATVYEVSALDIYDIICAMLPKFQDEVPPLPQGRWEWEEGNASFIELFSKHLMELEKPTAPVIRRATPKAEGALSIAFMGNFEAPESTENMVKWALEDLGHEVEPIQENAATMQQINGAAAWNDVFVWVRTPGWLQVPDAEMTAFLQDLQIPSLSLHLDKFWGIPEREELIGKLAFWKTKFVFTADGSRQIDFLKRGVNHFWMKPAMSRVYLHPGVAKPEYMCDVGFVGARHYHREYPFRPSLIEFLETRYKDRFRHIEGIRGHELNNVYASMKCVIGDCIFAGTPRYWSDRVPETIGRYGLLIHPRIEGLEVPVVGYEAQNLESLEHTINTVLENYNAVKPIVNQGTEYIARHDTWTVRCREILEQVCQ